METVSEEWRQVKGYEGLYEVSNLGNIKSIARIVQRSHGIPRKVRERLLKVAKTPKGYCFVNLYCGGQRAQRYVHQIVAEAFIGGCPHNSEVNHKDTDKSNNAASNLEYITHAENMAHAKQAGAINFVGERNPSAVGTAESIRLGYAMVLHGATYVEAGKAVGLKPETLASACRGVNWKCLNLKPLRKI